MQRFTRLFTRKSLYAEDEDPWRLSSIARQQRDISLLKTTHISTNKAEKQDTRPVNFFSSIEDFENCFHVENAVRTDDNIGQSTDATEFSKFTLDVNPEVLAKADDYSYDVCLGKGQFSTVYKAWNRKYNQIVAVKKVDLANLTDHEMKLCTNEIQLLRAVNSPYVLRLLDNFVEKNGEILCVALELMSEGDLERQIESLKNNGLCFSERSIWFYFHQICCGLLALHEKRIIHRDLKPGNVFMSSDGRCKLGDLGMSRMVGKGTKRVKTKCGSAYYMAPEVNNVHGYHFKSDIWSLGCLLYEMCNLCVPFLEDVSEYALCKRIATAKPPPIFPVHFSKYIRFFIDSCLSVNADNRPTIEQCQSVSVKMHQVFQSHISNRRMRR